MWVIKNIKYNNYYKLSISKNDKHFVLDIAEAKRMTKQQANNILKTLKQENYILVKVTK